MSDKEVEEYIKRLDEGLALAEQEMLQDKASRNETIVYSDGHGNIKRALASDVLAKISKDLVCLTYSLDDLELIGKNKGKRALLRIFFVPLQ